MAERSKRQFAVRRNGRLLRLKWKALTGLWREEEIRDLVLFVLAIAICDGLALGYMLRAPVELGGPSIATLVKPAPEKPRVAAGCISSQGAKLLQVGAVESIASAGITGVKLCASQAANQ